MRRTSQGLRPTKEPPRARQPTRAGRACRDTLLQLEELEGRVVPSSIILGPSKDNTLYQSATGDVSNGAGPNFFAGLTNRSSIRRGLIAFDIADNIPAGSTINSVTLTLHVSQTQAGPEPIELRRVQADWGEGTSNATTNTGQGAPATTNDATWVYRFFNTVKWANPGGDFVTAASASTSVGGVGTYTWGSTAQMVADVQSWLQNPAGNFGWILLGNETATESTKRFDSKENATAADRPTLTIDYTNPTPSRAPAQDTAGVFDPGTANWFLRNHNSAGAPDIGPFNYGAPGWVAVVGDWNGDGTTTIGVVDPATMTWYLRNENSPGAPDVAAPFRYGLPGWIPVAGDWGGTGRFGIGVFDPSTGTWYLRNEASPGSPDAGVFPYGAPGWVPVVGDWNGDGKTTVGVVDPGSMTWYLRNENSAGAPDAGTPFAYGLPGWRPVAGDWGAGGRTGIGVFDPSGTWYLRNTASPGVPDVPLFAYGLGSWTPLAGAWAQPSQSRQAAHDRGPAGGGTAPFAGQDFFGAALGRLQATGAGPAGDWTADALVPPTHRADALDQVFASWV